MDAKEKAKLLIKLLQNEEFLARFNDAEEDLAKTKELFVSEGLELDDEQLEVIVDALRSARKAMYNGETLDEAQMENVSGGKDGLILRTIKRTLTAVILTAGIGVTLYGAHNVYKKVGKKGGFADASEIAGRATDKLANFLAKNPT